MIERDDRGLGHPRLAGPEDLVDGRVRVRGERADPRRQIGDDHAHARKAVERREPAEPRIMAGNEHLGLVAGTNPSVKHDERPSAVGSQRRIASPAGRDDVQPAVTIEVARGQPIPAARPSLEPPRCRCDDEPPRRVEQELDRSPLAGEQQVAVAIAIDVRERRARHEPRRVQGGVVRRIRHEPTAVVPKQHRRRRLGVPSRDRAAADEQVEVSITVVVA